MAGGIADLTLLEEAYDGPGGRVLVPLVQQEYVARYGGPDATPVDPAEFAPPHGRFLIVYLAGEPVGCGGVRIFPEAGEGVAEIKRMYVVPGVRGRGIARRLLAELETAAREAGCRQVRLETGHRQPEAIGLYTASGYARIPSYGFYRCEPGSRCFGKTLEADPALETGLDRSSRPSPPCRP